MKTEFLKSLNLSQEVIDKIMAENGKDIAVEQKKAEKVIQERDSYKLKAESLETQVNDANTEIQKFKDMDIDGIKKAADDWKETAEKAKADAEKLAAETKNKEAAMRIKAKTNLDRAASLIVERIVNG